MKIKKLKIFCANLEVFNKIRKAISFEIDFFQMRNIPVFAFFKDKSKLYKSKLYKCKLCKCKLYKCKLYKI